jgi:WXG100 family type VII secretion target
LTSNKLLRRSQPSSDWRGELALPVEVVVSELQSAAARLRDAGQRLQDGLSSVDLETRELLGSGWKGDAASAFGKEWEKWHGGAGQVVRGLQTMSDLLTVASKEYAKTDEQAADALGSTMQGSGGSGGGTPGSGAVDQSTNSTAQGASGDQMAQQARSLAEQMDLAPLSQMGQVAGQVASGLGQAGQVATGMAQGQPADESAERDDQPDGATGGDPSATSAPVEPARPQSPPGSAEATGAVERPAD